MDTVYPLGYSRQGHLVEQLMADPKKLIIDTRHSPNSKMPAWTGAALKAKYGERYRFAGKYLGNVNHWNGGPMVLANPAIGIRGLVMYLREGYDLIILCGCAEFQSCHRRLVVDLLCKAMPEVEVVFPEQATQSGMIKCISIMQPWAWIIMSGDLLEEHGIPRKLIENRSWTTEYRGPLLLRAGGYDSNFFKGKKLSRTEVWYYLSRLVGDEAVYRLYEIMPKDKSEYPSGGIVGQCNLTDVLDWHADGDWKVWEQYGLVLSEIKFLPFTPVKGAFKLFEVSESVLESQEVLR